MKRPFEIRGIKEAEKPASSRNTIQYIEGPLGLAGSKTVVGWRDTRGFHRIYVSGYETPELAASAAREEASALGYVVPRWWQFWKTRMTVAN